MFSSIVEGAEVVVTNSVEPDLIVVEDEEEISNVAVAVIQAMVLHSALSDSVRPAGVVVMMVGVETAPTSDYATQNPSNSRRWPSISRARQPTPRTRTRRLKRRSAS